MQQWIAGGLIDPPRLFVSLGPLAVYLLALGFVNLTRRPWLTTGARDTVALAIGVSGLVLIGPVELLTPARFVEVFGGWVWLLWIAFYGLFVALAALAQLPRLTIYNLSLDEFYPLLSRAAQALDPETRWAGDTLLLPGLRVQLRVESFGPMRNVSLVSVGERQSLGGWRRLELALSDALRETEVRANPRGVSLVLFGLLIVVLLAMKWISDPQAITQGFVELLRL